MVQDQQPHLIVLVADRMSDAASLTVRVGGAGRVAAHGGAELWLAGGAPWPRIDEGLEFPSFAELGQVAARRASGGPPPPTMRTANGS